MIDSQRRAVWRSAVAGALALAAGPVLRAQTTMPANARILVGFPPGGAPDIVARRLADALAGKLASAVIVDNRPGAGGRIAIDAARLAAADGTTLLLNPAGVLTINPHSYRKLNYDPARDFTPISLAAWIDFGFAVGPAVPSDVRTLAQFAAWAKANPGKASFGSPAAGSPPHFVGDAVSQRLGLAMTHVPYRGSGPALTELMGGQISALVLTLGDLVQPAKAGRLRLLALTGPARSPHAPDVPTFTEQGLPGLEMRDWFGIYIAGTPGAEVTARVAALVRAAASSPGYVQALETSGIEAGSSTPQELDRLARVDLDRWAPIVKASGFVADV